MRSADRSSPAPWLLSLALAPLLLAGCAVNPRCPGSLLPIVEIQVNNTASNHDDYGSTTGFTPSQARITNVNRFQGGFNFPGGVQVELRNPAGASNLTFSATGGSGAGSASIFSTLPGDGGWAPVFVRGTATSTVDKSANIEAATAGSCNEVVLARKALMIGASPIPAGPQPRVEIEIGSVATLDDYLTWSPTSSRIRWANGSGSAVPLNVTLRNLTGSNRLRFADNTLAGGITATGSTLALALPGNGDWVRFFVAGNFNNASVSDKDAVMEVVNTGTGALLSREGMMVRIRKNANGLSVAERNRYLEALRKLNLTYNDYVDFVRTHSRDSTGAGGSLVSHRQAHSGSGFLPWHRVFVLHLERLLQAVDPSVALHYWYFDAGAPNVFNQDFMGANSTGNFATLSATNPIVSWSLAGEGVAAGIQRRTPYGDTGQPAVLSEVGTLGLGSPAFTYAGFTPMEALAHNLAHSSSGLTNAQGQPLPGASWIAGSPAIAPRDPLFFFLHSNVDRLWAKWQWLRDRYTATDVAVYDLQGSHATPAAGVAAPAFTQNGFGQITANRTLGQYADDSIWPWDNVTAGTGTAQRPDIAILTPLPITLGGVFPFAQPTVKSTIDYLVITGTGPAVGMGYAYDDFFPY